MQAQTKSRISKHSRGTAIISVRCGPSIPRQRTCTRFEHSNRHSIRPSIRGLVDLNDFDNSCTSALSVIFRTYEPLIKFRRGRNGAVWGVEFFEDCLNVCPGLGDVRYPTDRVHSRGSGIVRSKSKASIAFISL